MKTSIQRVLVVGLGSIGQRHTRIIRHLFPEIKIVVLRHKRCYDDDVKTFGLFDCVTTIEDALACQPEVAILANPATKHIEVATKLADAGIHLLVEKPISASTDGVRELIDLCEEKQLTLMVGYNLRFLPSLQFFRKKLEEEIP